MNSAEIPKTLKLKFSKTTDFDRVSRMFEPEVKNVLDPDNHVARRLDSVLKKAVDSGRAVFMSDEKGDIKTMIVAYHAYIEKDHATDVQHDYTELGTMLSFIPGYKSSLLVTAVLALREWLNYPPVQKIAVNIEIKNDFSVKALEKILGWKTIRDKDQCISLDRACWKTVLDEKADPMRQVGFKDVPKGLENMGWFECDGKVLARQAQIVLDSMKQGGFFNKQEHFIPVDFSTLEKEGLTRPLLEAIAVGVTSRDALKISSKHLAVLPDNYHDDE
ncbi:MAG: hypothetical protein KAI61_00815 [Alphaproteobacteria bacterium]|nr:hypothetical protein [Alphaproteobacteria bacterium]